MKVLHIYPKNDNMIAQHVSILTKGMQHSADVQATDSLTDFKARLQDAPPDIVHCHGCWHYAVISAAAMASKRGVRIVISPHGQLEPWVTEEKSPQEKLQKILMRQRNTISSAYALIAFGRMEQRYLKQLKWNPRIEVIHNALITNSISPQEMCSQTFSVYQKVLDSNPLEQMNDSTRQLLATIIKAGIKGDTRWVTMPSVVEADTDWRRLLLYAEHQNIKNYVDYGINVLGLHVPGLDTAHIPVYYPDGYKQARQMKSIVGEYEGDETSYLLKIIQQIERRPVLLHLIELTRELYRDSVNDDQLQERLQEKKLQKFASRLMQILSEQALLEEGFMPLPPTNDRGTQKIRDIITNDLKI